MAREQRKDVDYFPHDCSHGRKMHIIESKYGNDGYATWFKVLEQLGKANNHYIDISDESVLMFLASVCRVDEDRLKSILNDLAKLGAIDKDLFENYSVIWSQKFLDSVADAYRKRKTKIFEYGDVLKLFNIKNESIRAGNTSIRAGMPEVIPKEENSKEENSREEEREENIPPENPASPPEKIDFQKLIDFFNEHRGNMPEVKIISDARKTKIKNLIKNHGKEKLKEVILKSEKSDFIQGENGRVWIADFDWITKPANFIKIIEGNYDNNHHSKPNSNNGSVSGPSKVSGRSAVASGTTNQGEFA